jgi:alcohol/geraniol dehydrogenase (NADP+)
MSVRALAQLRPGGPLEHIELPPRGPPGPFEVDLVVDHCSLCHSDLHLLQGDWGEPARPLVVGHEIVGRVVAKGSAVSHAEGAVLGLGWQAGSCGACEACTSERAHLCAVGKVRTCVGNAGGFAEVVRADARFCHALPPRLDAADAGPLLCAGITVYSALERLWPTTRKNVVVGVVGFGGLGHLAVQFANRMGAGVVAFDPDERKAPLAKQLGASAWVNPTQALPRGEVDLLLITTPARLKWDGWLTTLRLEGTLCLLGIPDAPLTIPVDPLLDEQKRVTGSIIGSPQATRRMLDFAATHGVRAITEHRPFAQAPAALERLRAGDARMRIVLDR